MKPPVCPVCETPVPQGAAVCSYCKRVFQPGDFDAKPDLAPPPPEEPRPRPSGGMPFLYVALGLLAFGGAFFLRRAPRPQSPPAAVPSPSSVPADGAQAPSAAPAPTPAEPERPAAPADGSAIMKGARKVVLEGLVFDAATGKALPRIELVFKRGASEERFSTLSGPKGAYRAILAWDSSGYAVSLRVERSTVPFMEDTLPSLRRLGSDRRLETARDLAASFAGPEEVFLEPGQTLKRDWAVVPSPK